MDFPFSDAPLTRPAIVRSLPGPVKAYCGGNATIMVAVSRRKTADGTIMVPDLPFVNHNGG
ncbi:hypothetical protein GQF03_17585 [Sneathiella chungangensis]|uniref:Uncharacterized protein n=1 Tax=Sneathiella chungangensis TaxID=1418234 RepID=A0A845MLW4_9PROT|nr:hypothetical protein [Sneathiella chungangensis]MZR24150.1 hypothetical protein [Sneathiella chungangensis]